MTDDPSPECTLQVTVTQSDKKPHQPGKINTTLPTSTSDSLTSDNCPICQHSLNNSCNVHVLLCKHRLHRTCATKLAWHTVKDHPDIDIVRCPLCRAEADGGRLLTVVRRASKLRQCCRRSSSHACACNCECECDYIALGVCIRIAIIAIILTLVYLVGMAMQKLMDRSYCDRMHCILPHVSIGALFLSIMMLLLVFCCVCICGIVTQ